MGGSTSAMLSGRTMPAIQTPSWDHTYVSSDCGWVWRCWGRCHGGSYLVTAPGDSYLANCLSKPDGTAAIEYGITGVCHQAANRILIPARTRVDRARGYWWSVFFFGHYGPDDWKDRLKHCYDVPPTGVELTNFDDESAQRTLSGKVSAMSEERASQRPPLDALMAYADEVSDQRASIDEMCALNHVRPLSAGEAEAFATLQASARREAADLAKSLDSQVIDRTVYLDGMRSISHHMKDEVEQLFGRKRFLAIYGEAGQYSDGLIDPETFLSGASLVSNEPTAE